MKLPTICLASLASATEKKVPPRHPLQRLNRLVEFTSEILNSGAFKNNSEKWIQMWETKFANNAERMEKNFSRGNQRCGFYGEIQPPHGRSSDSRERRDAEFDRYDRVNPCIGMKQIITGFSKWSKRYIASCSGQKNFQYQAKRMQKWSGIMNKGKRLKLNLFRLYESYNMTKFLYNKKSYQFQPIKALKCAEIEKDNLDSYTFVRPDDNLIWKIPSREESNSYNYFEAGHSLQVSESCNPNLIYSNDLQFDCEQIKLYGGCDLQVTWLIFSGQWNTHGHLETFLHCPQCGCGSEGAANLNDLYDAEQDGSRKVSDVANTMFENHFNNT